MARKAMINKAAKKRDKVTIAVARGAEHVKHKIRAYNTCGDCGRPRGFIRFFGLCRICLRQMARKGEVPGLTKSSW